MVRYILCFNHVYYHSEINKIEVLLICFANQELITDTGNRDQVFLATPLGLFSNFPGPLRITSCVKTYETCEVEFWRLLLLADIYRPQTCEVEFWRLLLLADIYRPQTVEVSICDRFCSGNFIVWSLDISGEFH